MRRIALLTLLLPALSAAGCGTTEDPREDPPPQAAVDGRPAEETADFDIEDPAYSLLGDSAESDLALAARAGERKDFRVPAALLSGLRDGPLAHTAIIRPWVEIESAEDAAYRRLNAGQRALYALTWADEEILSGGFEQFFGFETGHVAPDLVAAAHRVGAPEYEAILRAGVARRDAGGGSYDDLDQRYAALQYRRRTSLAIILGAYVAGHRDEFVAAA